MTQKEIYDLIIIGTGPGGYVAAVRAAQLGLKVACVEKEARLGGVCLNIGCIPSKALLDSSEYFHLAKDHFASHGIKTGKLSLDLPAMMARKDQVVKDLTDNVRKLLEGNSITVFHGTARLAGVDRVEISKPSGSSKKGNHRPLKPGPSSLPPAVRRFKCPAWNLTANISSLLRKPCHLKRFPSTWVLWEGDILVWNWDRSGFAWAQT